MSHNYWEYGDEQQQNQKFMVIGLHKNCIRDHSIARTCREMDFNFFVTFSLIVLSRIIAKSILYRPPYRTENIAIYVDKDYSAAIIDSINHLNQYAIIAIISDNKESKGLYINGVEIYNISDLKNLITNKKLSNKLAHTAHHGIPSAPHAA